MPNFICNKCGGVIDVPALKRKIKNDRINNNHIHSCETTYYGICEKCLEEQEEAHRRDCERIAGDIWE